MTSKQIFNILIAGTGGQGIFTLSNLIRKLASQNNLKCEGATFKGGAQRMGTVYTELRICTIPNEKINFSSQIIKGELDLLIGLEVWETLRFAKYCKSTATVITSNQIEKLHVERMDGYINMNPLEKLMELFPDLILVSSEEKEIEPVKSSDHMNVRMLKEIIKRNLLPFRNFELPELNELNKNL